MYRKLQFTIALFFILSVSFAQEEDILYTPLSYNFTAISIDSVLNQIERDIEYYFIYNSELIAGKPTITAEFTNFPLTIILDSLFKNPILEYQIIQKQIVIFKNTTPNTIIVNDSIAPKYKIIKGSVRDSSDNSSLPFSTISILNKGVGSISNLDGKFNLKIRENYFADTLVISHLGYKPLLIKVSDLKSENIYNLNEKAISLQEILIRWTDPKELIIKALKAVRDNYPDNPSQLRAFYRESLQRNNKYMIYTEGLLDVYKGAYRPTLFRDQAKLLQLRKFTNIESNDSILIKLQGGIKSSLSLDLIKQPLEFLELRYLDQYDYNYSGIETISDIDAHTIEFEPNRNSSNMIYKGVIHIDPKSLAIIRIQFGLVKNFNKRSNKNIVVSSKARIKILPKDINYVISYKKINNKFYINHITGDLILKVKRKRKLLSSNYKLHFEMITTDMTTTNIQRFRRDERVKSRQILSDIENTYIENLNQYWGIDNFILPEDNLLKALGKFNVEELTYCPN